MARFLNQLKQKQPKLLLTQQQNLPQQQGLNQQLQYPQLTKQQKDKNFTKQRKKELEERRKKILEEREAAKKAKEAETQKSNTTNN